LVRSRIWRGQQLRPCMFVEIIKHISEPLFCPPQPRRWRFLACHFLRLQLVLVPLAAHVHRVHTKRRWSVSRAPGPCCCCSVGSGGAKYGLDTLPGGRGAVVGSAGGSGADRSRSQRTLRRSQRPSPRPYPLSFKTKSTSTSIPVGDFGVTEDSHYFSMEEMMRSHSL